MPDNRFSHLLKNWFGHPVLVNAFDATGDLIVLSWYGHSPCTLVGWRVLNGDEFDDLVATVTLAQALDILDAMPVGLHAFITSALANPPSGYRP